MARILRTVKYRQMAARNRRVRNMAAVWASAGGKGGARDFRGFNARRLYSSAG